MRYWAAVALRPRLCELYVRVRARVRVGVGVRVRVRDMVDSGSGLGLGLRSGLERCFKMTIRGSNSG